MMRLASNTGFIPRAQWPPAPQVFEDTIHRTEQRIWHSLRSIMGGDTKQVQLSPSAHICRIVIRLEQMFACAEDSANIAGLGILVVQLCLLWRGEQFNQAAS